MVDTGMMHQVPALVIAAGARVGEHQGYRFGKIQRAPAANANDRTRLPAHQVFDSTGQLIHIAGFGLGVDIYENDRIVGCYGEPEHEVFPLMNFID